MAARSFTAFGTKMRTATRRRFVLVGKGRNHDPRIVGYTDNPASAQRRMREMASVGFAVVVVDLAREAA